MHFDRVYAVCLSEPDTYKSKLILVVCTYISGLSCIMQFKNKSLEEKILLWNDFKMWENWCVDNYSNVIKIILKTICKTVNIDTCIAYWDWPSLLTENDASV